MAREKNTRFLANILVLTGFGWLAILISLTPVDSRASAPATPDLLFCIIVFFTIRRPGVTPGALILVMGLLRDLAAGGPVGPGALTLWAGAEFLRFHRETIMRSIFAEAGAVAAVIIAVNVIQLAVLLAAFTPSPPLEVLAAGAALTFVSYLILGGLLRLIFRIRMEPAENHKLIGRSGRAR